MLDMIIGLGYVLAILACIVGPGALAVLEDDSC